jgi:hypothetical protein
MVAVELDYGVSCQVHLLPRFATADGKKRLPSLMANRLAEPYDLKEAILGEDRGKGLAIAIVSCAVVPSGQLGN